MLPKVNRANPAEINFTREEGRLIPGSLFGLLVVDLQDKQPTRLAFIVSKKLDKRAVKRNRIKRFLHQAVATNVSRLKPGQVIVFLAKRSLLTADLAMIKEKISSVFEKEKLFSSRD